MDVEKTRNVGEVNIKDLAANFFNRKWYFLASLVVCLGLAYAYTKIAAPQYEVSTSLLLDPSGKNRQLGESKYVEGGIGLIETEKNLYNEMAILKSYSLIEQALKNLPFGVSYHARKGLQSREYYKYFPLKVSVAEDSTQLYGAPFEVEFIGNDKFRLILDANDFTVSDPLTQQTREIKEPLNYTKNYSFGEVVSHPYFHFTVEKPEDEVDSKGFENHRLFFQLHSMRGLANDYHERLKVEQVDIQASILRLNITGQSPEKEIHFLESLSNAFINRELIERDEIAASKESFIRQQLESISDSLARAEGKLQRFKQGANAVDLTRTATNTLDQLQRLETEKGQLSLNVKYYQSLQQYINDSEAIDKIVSPSVAGINDPMLSENLLELKRLNNEKTRLEFYKGVKSYDIVLINEQLKSTRNALKETIQNLINTETLKLNDRNQRIARLENTISRLPINEQRLVNFQRDNTLYGNMYNYLNQELAKTAIARAEDTSDTKVIDKPRQLGDGPVAPQKILVMLLAAIIGFIIPLTHIVFSDGRQETIQHSGQIQQRSQIPLLTEIGIFNKTVTSLANYQTSRGKEETFRNLSATLQFLIPNQENNVIGITSTLPGEGKTFCAINLAVNYAKAGKKTLLMDLNLRNPSIATGLNLQNIPDLISFLSDPSSSVETVTQRHAQIANLFYIPTKTSEENPHQYLLNKRLDTLITALKYEYDYVIIDSPALGLVSDYLLISRFVDINLFVIRKGITKGTHLNIIEDIIRKGSIKNPLIVFNGSTEKTNLSNHYPGPGDSSSGKALRKRLLKLQKIGFMG